MAWEADYDVYSTWPNPHARHGLGFAVEFIEPPIEERLVAGDFQGIRDASVEAAEYLDDRSDPEGVARSDNLLEVVKQLTEPVVVEAYTPLRRQLQDDSNREILGWGVISKIRDKARDYEVSAIDGVFVRPGATEHVEDMTDEDLAIGILSSLLHASEQFTPVVLRNRPASAETVRWLAKLGFQETPRQRPHSRGHLSLVTDPYPGYEFSTTPYKEELQQQLVALYPFLQNGGSIRRWG